MILEVEDTTNNHVWTCTNSDPFFQIRIIYVEYLYLFKYNLRIFDSKVLINEENIQKIG